MRIANISVAALWGGGFFFAGCSEQPGEVIRDPVSSQQV